MVKMVGRYEFSLDSNPEWDSIYRMMKTVVDTEQQDTVLRQWYGAQALIWMFYFAHRRLALKLFRPEESEVIYIVAVGCEHIAGPFLWKDARVSIRKSTASTTSGATCYVTDETVGFELRCSVAVVVRGMATDVDKTFENFLGDTPDIGG